METKKNKQVFLVLVPHRDIRLELQKYSDLLFKNGLTGVYTFPQVAPLASVSRSLNTDELKLVAGSLRKTAGDDKFNITEASTCAFPAGEEEMTLFGQVLELNNRDALSFTSTKIKYFFSQIIFGVCLIPKTHKQQARDGLCGSWSNPQNSFRAAAIANMSWKPVKQDGEIAYMWKIGKLTWLPKKG